jgi:hypothetical protein
MATLFGGVMSAGSLALATAFGDSAIVYTPSVGPPVTTWTRAPIWDPARPVGDLTQAADVEIRRPILTVWLDDLAAAPTQADLVTVDGAEYRVHDWVDSGDGFARLHVART